MNTKLSVKLESTQKSEILEELSLLLNSFSFPDTDLICQDGKISLNRIFLFFLFPDLADTFPFTSSTNPVVFLPDFTLKDIWKVSVQIGTQVKMLNLSNNEDELKENVFESETEIDDLLDNAEINVNLINEVVVHSIDVKELMNYERDDFQNETSLSDYEYASVDIIKSEDDKKTEEVDANNENSQYNCTECDYKTAKQCALKQHIHRKHGGYWYFCPSCSFKAQIRSEVLKHRIQEHNALSCDKCAYLGKTVLNTDVHKKTHAKAAPAYACNSCEFRSNSDTVMKIHKKSVHRGFKKHCNQCEYRGEKYGSLTKHKMAEHGGLQCDDCEYFAKSPANLQRHKLIKHSNIPKDAMTCSECDYKTNIKKYLKTHLSGVHGDMKYYCDECDYVSNRPESLRDHTSKHLDVNYTCDHCEFTTHLQKSLKKHRQTMHDGTVFICEVESCNYETRLKASMKSHVLGTHEGQFFQCEKCDYTARHLSNLKHHIDGKHKGNIQKCNECPYESTHRVSMVGHKRQKHGKHSQSCDHCHFATCEPETLTKHMKSKHEQKIVEIFPCKYFKCSYKASSSLKLSLHFERKHEGTEPTTQEDIRGPMKKTKEKIICHECSKVCKCTADLKDHMRIHTGEKPFGCRVSGCDKMFRLRSLRNDHERRNICNNVEYDNV